MKAKAIRCLTKFVCFFLFIIMSLQLSGLTCFGEEAIPLNIYDKGFHLKTNTDNEDQSNPSIDNCPCHLNLTPTLYTNLTSYKSTVTPVMTANLLYIKNITDSIFQPPRTILL